jgi:hypothetical protein
VGIETAFIVGDVQAPCYDASAWEVAMQIGADLRPDVAGVNGDLIEFRNLSMRYAARVDDKWGASAHDELKSAQGLLAEFMKRVRPKKRAFFNEGNHEWRLFRVISSSPQALQMLNLSEGVKRELGVQALLGLERMGIHYSGPYPNGTWLFNRKPENNVFVHHSYTTRKKAGYQAHHEIDTRLCSTITGHGERLACVWRRGLERKMFAVEGGNLSILGEPKKGADIYTSVPFNAPEFLDRQQGVVVVYLDGNDLYPVCVPIHNGRAVFNGKAYRA